MALLATVCRVKVLIPPAPSAAVVVGAAMLGRCAAELHGNTDANDASHLWDIMVSVLPNLVASRLMRLLRRSR